MDISINIGFGFWALVDQYSGGHIQATGRLEGYRRPRSRLGSFCAARIPGGHTSRRGRLPDDPCAVPFSCRLGGAVVLYPGGLRLLAPGLERRVDGDWECAVVHLAIRLMVFGRPAALLVGLDLRLRAGHRGDGR